MAIPQVAKDALIEWYRRSARRLPWRDTRDPYRILVSEVMLQQTQADRVVPKYHEFLERFPTLVDLADASPADVIRAWAGLGYNRRALNLQRTCRAIVERHEGVVPREVTELAALPGVGPYTAGAIACFAYEQDVGIVDVNIRRVIHRVVAGPDEPHPMLNERQIAQIAADEVPPGEGYTWNQALMELGATICRARSTACLVCPMLEWCAAAPTIQTLLALTPRTRTQPSVPFEQTSRYARGRIVDILRTADGHGMTATDIFSGFEGTGPALTQEQIDGYLVALERDGLVETYATSVSGFAETSPEYDGNARGSRRRYRLPT